jgi:hypothetical protein
MREDHHTSTVEGAAGWAAAHADADDDRPSRAEAEADEYYAGPTVVPAESRGIRCAHCKARHETVADVRWCKDLTDEMRAEALAEQEAEAASERAFARSLEARAERGGPDHEADAAEAMAEDPWSVPPPIRDHEAVTFAGALGYTGECENGHCDVYNRCKKHRAQDAASGVRNAMTKSYND